MTIRFYGINTSGFLIKTKKQNIVRKSHTTTFLAKKEVPCHINVLATLIIQFLLNGVFFLKKLLLFD